MQPQQAQRQSERVDPAGSEDSSRGALAEKTAGTQVAYGRVNSNKSGLSTILAWREVLKETLESLQATAGRFLNSLAVTLLQR